MSPYDHDSQSMNDAAPGVSSTSSQTSPSRERSTTIRVVAGRGTVDDVDASGAPSHLVPHSTPPITTDWVAPENGGITSDDTATVTPSRTVNSNAAPPGLEISSTGRKDA